MAEWATLKLDQGLRSRISIESAVFPLLLGGLLARGSILGLYPFGVAFGSALLMRGERGAIFGILGILIGVISLGDVSFTLQVGIMLAVLTVLIPALRNKKHEGIYLAALTGLLVALISSLAISLAKPNLYAFFSVGLHSVLAGGFTIIFRYAMCHQEAIWRGEFQREQGIAWLVILIGVISGLQGVLILGINFSVVCLSFFILFVSERYGAGTSAGVGAILGFMPQLTSINTQNLMDAGIYGLAGFCTGVFRRFGKLGSRNGIHCCYADANGLFETRGNLYATYFLYSWFIFISSMAGSNFPK